MGRQIEEIISSLGPLTGGTVSINANLTDIESLLTTLQADVADGISVTGVLSTVGTIGQLTNGTVVANPTSGSSASVTTFSATTSSQILPLNSSRKALTIFNSTPNVLYVRLGSSAVSSSTFSFALGEKELLSLSNITTELRGIYATSGTAYVTEIT